MVQRYVTECVKRLLKLTVILMFLFSTSVLKQCRPKTTETFMQGDATIRNVGIKLCLLKCSQNGLCDIPIGPCAFKICSHGQRCLKTRSGKAVCVQDEMQNYPEKSPQHQHDLLEGLEKHPVHDACRKGDKSRLRRILSSGIINVNRKENKYGRTPLMVAAYNGHRTVLDMLMEKGANMSYVDNNGNNVLQWACMGGHVAMVRYVLKQHTIVINCRAHYGETPLMNAVYYGHIDVFAFLVSMGANLSLVDDGGDNILHWACMGGHVAMVEYVLSEYGFDVNNRGKSGSTPLMTAATYGHRDVFEFVRCMGANVLQVDDKGNNILHWACSGGNVGMVKHVISQHIVDINSRTKTGKTPLMTAVYYGYQDVFDVLVNEGANASQMDQDGDNILHFASFGGHSKMIQYIISQNTVDINSRGRYERTPLMRAAYYGHRKAFEILVKKGCLTQLVDDQGYNILHLASSGGRLEMVTYILSQNMTNINARDKGGNTAAMLAKRNGKMDVYNYLVSRGSRVK